MSNPTRTPPPSKPDKPYEGFPLFSHPSGQWAKKIRKRLVYFGSWRNDREGTVALERFNREWPYLQEGRTPPVTDLSDGCTLRQLTNAFLEAKEDKMNAGDLSPRSFRDYYRTCSHLIAHFGTERRVDDFRPEDFAGYRRILSKTLSPSSLGNAINRVRIVLNFAFDNHLIKEKIRFGQSFARPSARQIRKIRNEAGAKLFERDEVLELLEVADVHLRAMILLGVNCGFGNSDVGNLPRSGVDLDKGWISFPRPKTEIPRRVPLWEETKEALRASLSQRPTAKENDDSDLVFITKYGHRWVRVHGPKHTPCDAVGLQFGKLLKKLEINGRKGLGFYTLRHCFETFAGESRDQVAVDSIMGHVDTSMAANYRHRISDERLLEVVETVRVWLFPLASASAEKGGEG